MKYAGIIYNDFAAAPGVCLTFFTQGCPHRCKGCYNQETWDFNGGREFNYDTLSSIIEGLTSHGIDRNLCIMGGEPMCPENLFLTNLIITEIKKVLPRTKIYLWTGYLFHELKNSPNPQIQSILSSIDYLIDGPYLEQERDVTLFMRGSRNQKIYKRDEKEWKEDLELE